VARKGDQRLHKKENESENEKMRMEMIKLLPRNEERMEKNQLERRLRRNELKRVRRNKCVI